MHCNYICRCCKAPTISFMRRLGFCQRGAGGSMSQVVGSNNSYKPITNTAWVHSTRSASDKDYQLLAHGRSFSPNTLASSTTKTGRHDIAETWINCMDCVFTPLLKWPSSAHVRKHMPISFRMSFPKTTCIIDGTEVFIEKPKSPTAQSKTYSNCKHANTYTALVSTTPSGAFNFVSELWGGSTSDKYITKECGFQDKFKPGDEVRDLS